MFNVLEEIVSLYAHLFRSVKEVQSPQTRDYQPLHMGRRWVGLTLHSRTASMAMSAIRLRRMEHFGFTLEG